MCNLEATKLGCGPVAYGVDFTFRGSTDVVYSFKQTEGMSYNYYLYLN